MHGHASEDTFRQHIGNAMLADILCVRRRASEPDLPAEQWSAQIVLSSACRRYLDPGIAINCAKYSYADIAEW